MQADRPALTMRVSGITKSFGSVRANDGVDFDVAPGEIHALVGENGAGKSTLMQILHGAIVPDAGVVELAGSRVHLRRPLDAIRAGVGLVHQHPMLIPGFSIRKNVTLGAEGARWGMVDDSAGSEELEALTAKLGISAHLDTPVGQLSMAQQQRVEVLKVLARGSTLLLLDEPTAVLTPQETDELFVLLRSLAEEGCAVVFISHKLREVMSLAHRVTVLRAGRTVGTWPVEQADVPSLVAAMTGRQGIALDRPAGTTVAADTPDLVEVSALTGGVPRDCRLVDTSFAIARGEIVGIASVDGNGAHSLVALLTGAAQPLGGSVVIDGVDLAGQSVAERRTHGVAHVPEDRHSDGLPLHGTVMEGLLADQLARGGSGFGLGRAVSRRLRTWASDLVRDHGIVTASLGTECSRLSGGNQQKIVVARELASKPTFVVMVQPTRGIDLPSSRRVHAAVRDVVRTGAAALVVSADLDELLHLTDRILVLYRGAVAADLDSRTVDRQTIGAYMMGTAPVAA